MLFENTSESYFVQAQHRFAPGCSACARYEAFFAGRRRPRWQHTARLTGLPPHGFFAKDLNFGLRWEFIEDWLVAAEYHNIHGTPGCALWTTPGSSIPAWRAG